VESESLYTEWSRTDSTSISDAFVTRQNLSPALERDAVMSDFLRSPGAQLDSVERAIQQRDQLLGSLRGFGREADSAAGVDMGGSDHEDIPSLVSESDSSSISERFRALSGGGTMDADDDGDDIDNILNLAPSPDEDDEFEAVSDDELAAPSPGQAASKSSRATLPTWLNDSYERTVEKLKGEIKQNQSRRPSCYDRGSFVEGVRNTFFDIDKAAAPSLAALYQPQYFIWLPHFLVKGIPCPCCASAVPPRKHLDGAVKDVMLWNHGWAEYPRRITDLDQSIYLIGCRYKCSHPDCSKTYLSWSPAILRALPPILAGQFSHHLTHRAGLSDRVVALLRSCALQGVSFHAFANMIRQMHIRRYEQLHLQYLQMIHARVDSLTSHWVPKYDHFGSFSDKSRYAGFVPTSKYFDHFYTRYLELHSREMDQYMSMQSARILCVDHSHKVVSLPSRQLLDSEFSI